MALVFHAIRFDLSKTAVQMKWPLVGAIFIYAFETALLINDAADASLRDLVTASHERIKALRRAGDLAALLRAGCGEMPG